MNDAYNFSDALVWVIVKYVEDPANITTAPVTILGQVVGTLVGILGIAIFAVPAGLIGSGLLDAMSQEKHGEEVIAKHKNNPTGSLAEFVKKCESSAKLDEHGISNGKI